MTREGVWNPNGEGEQPDIPGGVAKDNAREKQPAIAYAVLYDRLKLIARDHGYALAMHGSLLSDCDLLAVPWTHDATGAQTLINALAVAAPGLAMSGSPRAHGRLSYIIHLGGGPYLDLSVMPLARAEPGTRAFGAYYGDEAAPPAPTPALSIIEDIRVMVEACERERAAPAPTLVKSHAQQVGHRCSGCGHEWEGRLVGPELCGDCWRKVRPVLHGEAEPPAPTPSWTCYQRHDGWTNHLYRKHSDRCQCGISGAPNFAASTPPAALTAPTPLTGSAALAPDTPFCSRCGGRLSRVCDACRDVWSESQLVALVQELKDASPGENGKMWVAASTRHRRAIQALRDWEPSNV